MNWTKSDGKDRIHMVHKWTGILMEVARGCRDIFSWLKECNLICWCSSIRERTWLCRDHDFYVKNVQFKVYRYTRSQKYWSKMNHFIVDGAWEGFGRQRSGNNVRLGCLKQTNKQNKWSWGKNLKHTCYKKHSSRDCNIFVGNHDKFTVVQYESVSCTTEVS